MAQRGIDLSNYPRIDVRQYIDNMDTCLAAADLVICRSGAITLSELEAAGKASILVPSPTVTENHQHHNAMVPVSYTHLVVITSDNPRSEDPMDIIREIIPGVEQLNTPYLVEPDRRPVSYTHLDVYKRQQYGADVFPLCKRLYFFEPEPGHPAGGCVVGDGMRYCFVTGRLRYYCQTVENPSSVNSASCPAHLLFWCAAWRGR